MKLLLASNNRHKADEIKSIFDSLLPMGSIELLIPSDLSDEKFVPDETGTTYFENAEIKCSAFFEKYGIPTIADDSGLELDALGGLPGVHSSSFGGEEGNHKLNRERLHSELKGLSPEKRTARFRAIINYKDSEQTFFVEGRVEGRIIEEERGTAGFGYDPMFVPDGFDRTFAEMAESEKNQLSHRYRAVVKLAEELKARGMV